MKQVTTGVNGLDKVLNGGFLRPSIVLIAGTAGTGKTTLVMQSIFNSAKNDEICMYITAISEPIAMINNFMSQFSFYNISLLAKGNVKYVPLDIDIIHKGSEAIIKEMEQNIEIIKPDRIVIDPVNVFAYGLDGESQRQFYYDFFTSMKGWNSLVLLTGEFAGEELIKSTLSYMVDGIIQISNEPFYEKNIRYLNVLKMRGQEIQGGKHSCKINKDGFMVFPRIHPIARKSVFNERISTGVKGLDKMTGGGFIRASSILISGSSGTGKTILGIQFIIDGLLKNEPGIIVSFEEDMEQIRENSKMFNWNLEEFENKNLLKIISPLEYDAYELALKIEETIDTIKAKRLLLDGTGRLQRMLPQYAQLPEYMGTVSSILKNKNITAVYTNETSNLTGATQITGMGISPFLDTVILLRYVEIKSEMRKAISVLKMKGSDHDKEIREIVITKNGAEIKLPFSEYSGLLSGNPIKIPSQAFVEAFKK
ncbi:Circadian clock protein kinase KaiC [uncultured archaeon]|nr:Circadian clock protein kinase KaiC [uncultured archaeon]